MKYNIILCYVNKNIIEIRFQYFIPTKEKTTITAMLEYNNNIIISNKRNIVRIVNQFV